MQLLVSETDAKKTNKAFIGFGHCAGSSAFFTTSANKNSDERLQFTETKKVNVTTCRCVSANIHGRI